MSFMMKYCINLVREIKFNSRTKLLNLELVNSGYFANMETKLKYHLIVTVTETFILYTLVFIHYQISFGRKDKISVVRISIVQTTPLLIEEKNAIW